MKNLWLSIFAWSILSASKLKTIHVREGTQSGEMVLDLHSAFDFTGDTVRHFKLQKESSVIDVSDDGKVLLKTLLDREELCGQGETCKFVSTVSTSTKSPSSIISDNICCKSKNRLPRSHL